ncbi:MAG TPA: hypothetical protein VEJ38_11635 [Candidatus Acidoferrales bacterium]|nr:hypothetical protein [Candidatus Acidoferrales bacterium]
MQPKDVPECAEIVASHPVIGARYGPAIRHLQLAWLRLLECEAYNATVFEKLGVSQGRICAVGVSLIVTDEFVRELKTPPLVWIGPELAVRLTQGRSPALSRKQLQEANSRGGLNLVCWEGCIRPEYETSAEVHRALIKAFIETHRGFLWKEIIASQADSADRIEWTVQTGGLIWDPVKAQYVDLSNLDARKIVHKPHLMGIMREIDARRDKSWAASWIGSLFDYSPPQLGFSYGEQKLLLLALAGEATDQELSTAFGVSLPTIKKMWLSIYGRVADRQPRIIPGGARAGTGASERGSEKRRHLLAYLREHPEELRPVSQRLLDRSVQSNSARA